MASPFLNSKGKPGWFPRLVRGIASRIDPELYEQEQGGLTFSRYGLTKSVGGKFGEFSNDSSQFAINRPGGGSHIDPEKAMSNNRGYVYAAVNAIGREVQNIDFRLFQVSGKNHKEQTEHAALDLLDGVNPDMIGPELKYLTSAHLNLVGNCYWLLTDKSGNPVKDDLKKPEAIYLMDPTKVSPLIDKTVFPSRIKGYAVSLNDLSRNTLALNVGEELRKPDEKRSPKQVRQTGIFLVTFICWVRPVGHPPESSTAVTQDARLVRSPAARTPRYFAGKVCAHHAANGLIAQQCAVCQYNT